MEYPIMREDISVTGDPLTGTVLLPAGAVNMAHIMKSKYVTMLTIP